MEAEEFLTDYIISLLEKYKENINLRGYTSESTINDCKSNFEDTAWVITECLDRMLSENWGLQKELNKLFEYKDYEDRDYILQIDDKFVKLTPYIYQKDSKTTAKFVNKVERLVPEITFE